MIETRGRGQAFLGWILLSQFSAWGMACCARITKSIPVGACEDRKTRSAKDYLLLHFLPDHGRRR